MSPRDVRWLLLVGAVLLAGCSKPQPAEAQAVSAIALDPPPAVAPQAPVGFEYTSDLGGKALARAVAPDTPAIPTIVRSGDAPQPRAMPARLLNPEATVRVAYFPPPVLVLKPVEIRIPQPPERVPPDLGAGAAAVPAKPKLPTAPAITTRSRDVNLPPDLPALGRPFADRASLDDPTAELSNAAIVKPIVKVPVGPSPFLKVGVPDPFELGEQIKPKVPPKAEPGLSPVPVNPRRVK